PRRSTLAVCARLNVTPVVLLRWEREERFAKRPLDRTHRLLTSLFFFCPLLCLDDPIQIRFERLQSFQEGCAPLIVDDAASGAGRQIEEGRVNEALQIPQGPGWMFESRKRCNVLDDSSSRAGKRDPAAVGRLCKIEFGISVAELRTDRGKL